MKDEIFASGIDEIKRIADTKHIRECHRIFIEFIAGDNITGDILDIGERNPLTEKIEKRFGVQIDSTFGDLDESFITLKKQYDIIIFSHVLEHVFNPLWLLERIKDLMKQDAVIYLATPIKPEWITWTRGHFHEMSMYRFERLIKRAELKTERYVHFRVPFSFIWRTFTGIRPFLYAFHKRLGIFKLKKG